MTILAHPNRDNVERYRVQDKTLGIQSYFSIAKYGDKALTYAKQKQTEIDEKRKLRLIRLDLDINQIFAANGSVIGLSRRFKKRGDKRVDVFIIQVTVEGKQRKTDVSTGNRTFQEAYKLAQDKILALRDIERSSEITQMFNSCAYLYKKALS